ncbi:MAG: ATP-binding protein [Planctomycetaceae bacterium]|nr:ATP-binding protein [Planctomycetaceae bacterium]
MVKANPGGSLDPRFIVGRDELIRQIWDVLERQCVLLNAERRIGKTSIVRKMAACPPSGWLAVFQDLEKIHTPEEFSEAVYRQVQQYLSWLPKLKKAAEEHKTGEYGLNSRSWKPLLEDTIRQLMDAQKKSGKRLVMLWDEVPYMINNIRKRSGEQQAVEVLDQLRSLRQENPELRMVFTGSVGLHHVLDSIQAAQISAAPVNDMYAIEVTPLESDAAKQLARELLLGESLTSKDTDKSAATIALEADYFPFFIHHIVAGLKLGGIAPEPDNIRSLVRRQLTDANDPWELGHFRKRIPVYYAQEQDARLVTTIMDHLAGCPDFISLNDLLSAVQMQGVTVNRDELIRVLRLMERDHYLRRNDDGHYQFRFELIKRWWKLDRGL